MRNWRMRTGWLLCHMLVVIWPGARVQAATRVFHESFDDRSLAPNTSVLDSNSWSFVPGHDSSGYALKLSDTFAAVDADGEEDARYELGGALPQPWPTDEFYLSVWVKTVSDSSPEECSPRGWKWFYPRFNTPGVCSNWYIRATLHGVGGTTNEEGFDLSMTNNIGGLRYSNWGGDAISRVVNRGEWIRFEYHFNIATAHVRMWVTFSGGDRMEVFDQVVYANLCAGERCPDPFPQDTYPLTAGTPWQFQNLGYPSIKTHNDTTCNRETGQCSGTAGPGSEAVWDSPYCEAPCQAKIGESPCIFYRVIDDLELWDGMPDAVHGDGCANGETRACPTGELGGCAAGTQTCSDGDWGACVRSQEPRAEVCGDGVDQDCDGADLDCPTAVSVSILTPESDPFTTTLASVDLIGTASSPAGSVVQVSWRCPTCSPTAGIATGTTDWSIAGIGLPDAGEDRELTADSAFDQSSTWTMEPGWGISGGAAHSDGTTTNSALYQGVPVRNDQRYLLEYEVEQSAAGALFISRWGFTTESVELSTSVGAHAVPLTCQDESRPLRLVSDNWRGSLARVSLRNETGRADITVTAEDETGSQGSDAIRILRAVSGGAGDQDGGADSSDAGYRDADRDGQVDAGDDDDRGGRGAPDDRGADGGLGCGAAPGPAPPLEWTPALILLSGVWRRRSRRQGRVATPGLARW